MGMRPRATIFFGVFATDVDWDDYSEDTEEDEYGNREKYEICEDISTPSMSVEPHGYEGEDMRIFVPGTESNHDWDSVDDVHLATINDARKTKFMADVAELGHGTDEPRWLIAVEYG